MNRAVSPWLIVLYRTHKFSNQSKKGHRDSLVDYGHGNFAFLEVQQGESDLPSCC